MRRGLRISLWTLGAIALLVLVLLGWLLYTESGRDFVLDRMLGQAEAAPQLEPWMALQIAPRTATRAPPWNASQPVAQVCRQDAPPRLPPAAADTEGRRFQYESADGTLGRGPLEFRGVRYTLDDGTVVRVDRLHVNARRLGLFSRELNVIAFNADGVEVRIPETAPDADADPGFALPETLPWPEFALPFDLDVTGATVRDLRIFRGEQPVFALERLVTDMQWLRGAPLRIESLEGAGEAGRLTATGTVRLDGVPHAELDIRFQPTADAVPAGLDVRPHGSGGLQVRLSVPDSGDVMLAVDDRLNWRLDVQLQGFEPGGWWPDAEGQPALDIALQMSGDRERAIVQGALGRDGRRVEVQPSTLLFDTRLLQLQLDPLRLLLDDGSAITATGDVGLGDPLLLDLALDAAPLHLPIGEGEPARYRGKAWVSGTPGELAVRLDGQLTREELQAAITLQGLLGEDSLQIERVSVSEASGSLAASGTVGWAPQPHWELDVDLQQFDPGVFAEALSGQLQGRVRSRGRMLDEGLSIDLALDPLTGRIRGKALRGEGEITLRPDGSGQADLAITLGDSAIRVRGDPGGGRDLAIDVEALQLADLLPDAEGRLSGRLRLRGVGAEARIDGRLSGTGVRFEEERIGQVEIELATPLDLSGEGTLLVSAQDLVLAGEVIDRLELDVRGSGDALRASIDAQGPRLAMDAALAAKRDGEAWSGQLAALQLRSGTLPDLALEQPADFSVGPAGFAIGPGCVRSEQGSACFNVSRQDNRQSVALQLEALPLSLLDPWLSNADQVIRVDGLVSGSAELQLVDGAPGQGSLELRSAEGAVTWLDEPPVQLISWNELRIDGRLQDGQLLVEAASVIDDDGSLQARIEGGSPFADTSQAIDGRIDLNLPQMRLLQLLPETVVAPSGQLQAAVALTGTWDDPRFAGDIELARFSAEIPALGITLDDSSLRLNGDLDRLQISGIAHSAGQPLRFDGEIENLREQPIVRIDIRGTDVLLVDTPQVRAIASPELRAEYSGTSLRLRGSITVPSARLRLDQLENVASVSNDVVVLDPRPEREIDDPLPIDADIQVVLGKDVELDGMGFSGGVSGSVRVRERPDRPTTARGSLAVRGEYTAYGQDLTIERGQLNYAATPIDDPALDLRVVREVRGTRVGLDIRGSARDPAVSVWSDPAIDQGEALSLLLFGRPLRATSEGDNDQLTQAALAVGGNLLAARLGARLGFDTFEVASSDDLGGTAFTVGKFLSPRLHIGYGVALFGEGQVFTLSYMISERLELELQAGQQNRAALNYRVER